ncbi:MarR family winged helix-turn-helix transcriptional regulator [Luteipulveratus mongoliensis]|uniref:HTH marR-type domain-containing protein n=1 Tax=Luteipulveratus mongoliensis TaxID=571913 RepID=A0A0K1JLP8_9MICO|nr:MarR family transcriptional regulator [Luteipulveratus mongoliensis]AKU17637.1 hypothetical protein VV02_20310 [Luteipulveratus mongoliensis]
MPTADDDHLVEEWRALQGTYFRTSGALERRLEADFGIGLSEFETLDLTDGLMNTTEGSPCAMKDLREVSCLTQSALSRVVDRLEKAGLIERSICDQDRRAMFVRLTSAGVDLHRDAQRVHRELLRDNLAATS